MTTPEAKTAEGFKEILLKTIPKNCYWEDMNNLTNCPVESVEQAASTYVTTLRQQLAELKEADKSYKGYKFKS